MRLRAMLSVVIGLVIAFVPSVDSILYVQQNEYRFYDQLDGLWTFVREPSNSIGIGLLREWHLFDLSKFNNATVMPVPAAYNDLGADAETRDHVGWVWYQTKIWTSERDSAYRHFLRFSSVQYYAIVFVNNKLIGSHEGGHLPFEFEVTKTLLLGRENRITVAVNNTLSHETIPPGEFVYLQRQRRGFKQYPDGFFKQIPDFDFFNYAGILRPVYLTKKPATFIQDIVIEAFADGTLLYDIKTNSPTKQSNSISSNSQEVVVATMYDENDQVIFITRGVHFRGRIEGIRLWWPRGMGDPILYLLEVRILTDGTATDAYRIKFGFRTVSFTNDQLFINGKPFYCRGFGMHEDFELIGRGYSAVVMTKDFNMLEWMNANCYRTSHYPYSEERALEADRRGFAVITETPGVGLL
ncbi:unnamed protein product [Anisakis simplex]|uniref:Beta-glucuronidase n=1 Tax=Anisakis simplex TaxID=6269 RepID=A0A0M3J135_ANISI|nr:unnamed protein product [Anisakis simplex]